MLELIGLERTGFLVFVNILMMFYAYWLFVPAIKQPFSTSITRRRVGYMVILLFCVFAFWGNDWFHVAISYQYLRQGEYSHLEDLYVYLIQNVCPEYLSFRFLVWGSALVLYGLSIKFLRIKKDIAWLCFVAVGLLWFSYARASLAMAMMYLGFVLYNSQDSSFRKKLIAIVLLAGSYYCHKSALFGIILILIVSHSKRIDAKKLLLLGICLPILYYVLGQFLDHYMLLQGDSDSDAWSASVVSAQSYLNRELSEVGLGLLLQQILERSTYILTAYIGIKVVSDENVKNTLPNNISALITLLIYMVVIAFMFQFDLGFNTSLIADRFFRFSFIPTSLLLTFYLTNGIYPKLTKTTFYLGLFATFYELFYCLYMHK